MLLDMFIARFSEIDKDGFIGVQVDNYGSKPEFGAVEAHHPFGFISRPRDPDVDGEGQVKLGATVLRLAEGNESHVIVLGDPRATPKVPALKKGGSAQYGFTGTAVSYAMFDGDDGSYLLETAGSADVKLGGPSAEFVALAAAVTANLNAIATAFTKLTSATGGLVAYLSPTDAYVPSSVATTKVKAV